MCEEIFAFILAAKYKYTLYPAIGSNKITSDQEILQNSESYLLSILTFPELFLESDLSEYIRSMEPIQIHPAAWTIIASISLFWGLANILDVIFEGSSGYQGSPNMAKGIFFTLIGLAYFVPKLIIRFRKKKS